MKRYAVNIDWDCDSDVELPNKVRIPNDIEDDEIADYISDNYGWCIKSFNIIEESNKHEHDALVLEAMKTLKTFGYIVERTKDCDTQDW